MLNKLQITEKITLDNLELLKVLSDPTRMEIMKNELEERRSGSGGTGKYIAE